MHHAVLTGLRWRLQTAQHARLKPCLADSRKLSCEKEMGQGNGLRRSKFVEQISFLFSNKAIVIGVDRIPGIIQMCGHLG